MVVVDGLEPLLILADEAEESRPERLQGLEHRQGHRALLHGDPKVPEGWHLSVYWLDGNKLLMSYQSSWFMYCSMADWPALNMCMSSGLWRRMAPLTRYLVMGWNLKWLKRLDVVNCVQLVKRSNYMDVRSHSLIV